MIIEKANKDRYILVYTVDGVIIKDGKLPKGCILSTKHTAKVFNTKTEKDNNLKNIKK